MANNNSFNMNNNSNDNMSNMNNGTEPWDTSDFYVKYPYSLIRRDFNLLVAMTCFIVVSSVPLSLFIIVQILRYRKRRTSLNMFLVFCRIYTLLALAHPILALQNNFILCLSTQIIFQGVILIERVSLAILALIRYLHIFYDVHISNAHRFLVLFLTVSSSLILSSLPFYTLIDETPPLYHKCLLTPPPTLTATPTSEPKYVFLFFFFIILTNVTLLEFFFFLRIVNYMRKNSVRVMVIPTTVSDRAKAVNIVTAPTSLIVSLLTTFVMAPPAFLLLKSPSEIGAEDVATLLNYQLIFVFFLGTVVPVLYIGSSAELREDVLKMRRRFCGWCIGEEGEVAEVGRSNVYAIETVDN